MASWLLAHHRGDGGEAANPRTCVSREQLNRVALLSLPPGHPHMHLSFHPLLPSGNTDVGSSTYTLQTPWVPSLTIKPHRPGGHGMSLGGGRFHAVPGRLLWSPF